MTRSTWWAPGRVNLVGDHTDYSGGLVLPLAIQLGTTASASARADDRLVASSTRVDGPPHRCDLTGLRPNAGSWASYVEGCAWVLQREGVPLPGADVRVDGDLPLGAGLSSSASLVCAVLGALLDVAGVRWDPRRVALAAQRVENEYVGAPVGVMDPLVVMLGQADHALLIDTRSLACEPVPLPLSRAATSLLVVDTGAAHSTAGDGYALRVEQCGAAARALGAAELRDVTDPRDVERLEDPVLRARARHVVTENQRVLAVVGLLREGRLAEVGPLLLASHASLRDDFAVSTTALDLVVETAVAAGALGARVTGAGFGGSAVVLVPDERADEVGRAVAEAFARAGLPPPGVLEVVASDAAGPHSAT